MTARNKAHFYSKSDAEATSLPATINYLHLEGMDSPGDNEGDFFFRVNSDPNTTVKLRTADRYKADGTIDQTNGGWWVAANPNGPPAGPEGPQGPQGNTGPAGGPKMQSISTSGSSLTINISSGDYVVLSLGHTVTSVTFTNWQSSPDLGRVTIQINNTGAFNITGWPTTKWANGASAPTITSGSGKIDRLLFTSTNSGTTILGSVLGQNFT